MSAPSEKLQPAVAQANPEVAQVEHQDAPAIRHGDPAELAGRIGPNAITQLESVLQARLGRQETARLFTRAGVDHHLRQPPAGMVDERDVARLHHQARRALPPPEAHRILVEAGDRTGRYILANRIPRPVVLVLRRLPASVSARLLARAIARHAWTFAGSGAFEIRHNAEPGLTIAEIGHNPVVALDTSETPICGWHAAVFQRLFGELVDPATTVHETDCCATGAPACRFEIRFG